MTRSRGPAQTTVVFALVNVAFMVALASMAALTMSPVFGSSRYVVLAVAAILAGAGVALLGARLQWSGFATAGLGVGVFALLGFAIAIPGVTSGDVPLLAAARELVVGPVTGWKDIVTLPLPLGDYGATLVPVLALLVGGTLAAVWAALTARRWWGLAGVVAVAMVATGIVVGPATRAEPLSWAPYGVYVNREFVIGLATFALLLAWLSWRASAVRRAALARSADTARLASQPRLTAVSTGVAAASMAVVAVGTAAIFAGPVAADTPRDVARSVIDPRVVVDSTVTPLAGYREYFTDARFGEVLFTVTVTSGSPSRVRLATLPYFTGDSFTASAPSGTSPTRFQRVPSSIAAPVSSEPIAAQVSIASLTGPWIPLVGELGAVEFAGDRAGGLVDSFFYQPESTAGIVTLDGGIATGDAYGVEAFVPESSPDLEKLGASPGGDVIDSSVIPPALTDWVVRQGVAHDGAGLAELVRLLRERGYLSHALEQGPDATRWAAALGEYEFAPSAAGHSYDRIERMFVELTTRESEARSVPGASLVAAVGDDEQFAAAVALMAAELGFPSRVVLGARLAETDPARWTVPVCDDGACRGQNMAVWAEVQGSNGAWVPVDVTPQHTTPPSPDVTQQRDPEFASALDPERAEPIAPPSAQRGSATDAQAPIVEADGAFGWLGPVLAVAGIGVLVLLVFALPLIAILVWKALRRRRRKRANPVDAIHHGWDEYVDTAMDAGLPPLPLATRVEAATAYGSHNGERLARMTDAATFGTAVAERDEAELFWELVAADREEWLASRGWWARNRMRFSMRSLWHSVAMQTPVSIPETTTGPAPGTGSQG
jgi:hypothetical protein